MSALFGVYHNRMKNVFPMDEGMDEVRGLVDSAAATKATSPLDSALQDQEKAFQALASTVDQLEMRIQSILAPTEPNTDDNSKPDNPPQCRTVGFLVQATKKVIVTTQSRSNWGQRMGHVTIPRVVVTSFRELK